MGDSDEPGEMTRLEPFANWWDEAQHNLTEVIHMPEPKGAARVKALLDGSVDLIQPVPVNAIALVNDSDIATVMAGPELRTIFLGMDQKRDYLLNGETRRPNPFRDQRVREAVYLAIDTDRLRKDVMRNLSTPSSLLISPFLYRPKEEVKRPPYNPDRARSLLAQAGYAKGFEVDLDCPRDRYLNDEELCREIAKMLASVGIKATPEIKPKGEFFEKVLAPNYATSLYLFGWLPSSFDPYNVIFNLLLCREHEGGGVGGRFNLGGYCNPKVDALAGELASSLDAERRSQLIAQIFALVAEDWGYVPLHQQGLAWGVANNLEIKQRADDRVTLHQVRIN